jgi:hypothetical protein
VVTMKDDRAPGGRELSIEEYINAKKESSRAAAPERTRSVGSASGSERDALDVVRELGRADKMAVSRHMSPPISSTYAEKLCGSLVKKGILRKEGRYFILASPPDNS